MEVECTKLQQIEQYYSECLYYIQLDNYKQAIKIIHNRMPMELYDSSLDILYNRNTIAMNKKIKKLKELIRIVDDKLTAYSLSNGNEDNFNNDIFIGDIF